MMIATDVSIVCKKTHFPAHRTDWHFPNGKISLGHSSKTKSTDLSPTCSELVATGKEQS